MKLKAKNDVVIPMVGVLKSGSVIDNTSNDDKKIIFKDLSNITYSIDSATFLSNFDNVPVTTPESVIMAQVSIPNAVTYSVSEIEQKIKDKLQELTLAKIKEDAENRLKALSTVSIVGLAAGLGFALFRKSSVLGYIGWSLLGAAAANTAYRAYNKDAPTTTELTK